MRDRKTRLAELLRSVDTSETLSDSMSLFFDNLRADPGLVTEAQPVVCADMTKVLAGTLEQLLGRGARARPGNVEWFRIAPHGFVHGRVLAGGCLGVAFFFEERTLGLVGLVTGPGRMLYGRMRALGHLRVDPSRC